MYRRFLRHIISNKDKTIHTRQSVTEFYKEWKIMKHCVFTNRYYAKKNTLILSAQIDGKHIETIELNLNTLKVVQCRAVHNGNSEHHEKILKTMKKNINLVRQCMTA